MQSIATTYNQSWYKERKKYCLTVNLLKIHSICIWRRKNAFIRDIPDMKWHTVHGWENPVKPVAILIGMLIRLDFISTSSYWKLISMSNLYANYYWESYDRNSCSVQHWMRIVLNELGLWLWYVLFYGISSYSSSVEKMFFKRRTRPTWGLPIWSGNWTCPFISTFYERNSHFFIVYYPMNSYHILKTCVFRDRRDAKHIKLN